MSNDTTKLDRLAVKFLDAESAAQAAAAAAATTKTAREVAFAEFHGAAAEYAALNGGRAKAIREAAALRVSAVKP